MASAGMLFPSAAPQAARPLRSARGLACSDVQLIFSRVLSSRKRAEVTVFDWPSGVKTDAGREVSVTMQFLPVGAETMHITVCHVDAMVAGVCYLLGY